MIHLTFRIGRRRNATKGHPMIQSHIVTNDGGLANHQATAVINHQALANASRRMNLNLREQTRQPAHTARHKVKSMMPQIMRQPMKQQRMKSRIKKRHLPQGARRRISLLKSS